MAVITAPAANLDFLTHPPDSAQVSIAFGIIRAILQALAGAGFTWAALDDNEMWMLASSVVFVGMAGWSVWQKIAANRRNRRASIQSAVLSSEATAAAGQPVAVVVTDPAH